MSVTVLLRLRARDGGHEALMAAVTQHFEAASIGSAGFRGARLFRSDEDARDLVYVGEWETRALFEALGPRSSGVVAAFDEDGPYFCRDVYSFEHMARRAEVVAGSLALAPPDAADAARELGMRVGRESNGLDGLAFYRVAEDTGRPGRLVVLHGWESAEALERGQAIGGKPPRLEATRLGVRVTELLPRARSPFDGPIGP